jgi:hypothetical protein
MYGLRARSEVPLYGRPVEGDGRVDLELSLGPAVPPPDGPPPGQVLAHFQLNAAQWYTFTRLDSGGYVLRFASAAEFRVDADLRRVVVHPEIGADPDLVPVFANGALPAFVLLVSGEPLLHASAVDVGGRAVAFVGSSGMGKSTMATLLCAAGALLITDDVLRLTPGPAPRCYLGPAELRLRKGAADLASGFAQAPAARRTGDGRDALRPEMATTELLPLAAIVVPLPDRQAPALELKRLDPVNALMALASFPRVLGWSDPVGRAQQFQTVGDVAAAVPVYSATVPWGPPFSPDLAPALVEQLGL